MEESLQQMTKSCAVRHYPPPVLSQLFFQVLSPEAQVCNKDPGSKHIIGSLRSLPRRQRVRAFPDTRRGVQQQRDLGSKSIKHLASHLRW